MTRRGWSFRSTILTKSFESPQGENGFRVSNVWAVDVGMTMNKKKWLKTNRIHIRWFTKQKENDKIERHDLIEAFNDLTTEHLNII